MIARSSGFFSLLLGDELFASLEFFAGEGKTFPKRALEGGIFCWLRDS